MLTFPAQTKPHLFPLYMPHSFTSHPLSSLTVSLKLLYPPQDIIILLLSLRLYISIPIPGGPNIAPENSAIFRGNLFTQTTFPNLNLPKSCSTSHGSLTYTLPTRHSNYFCSTDTMLPQHLLQANFLKHIGVTHVTQPHLLRIHLSHFTHRRELAVTVT